MKIIFFGCGALGSQIAMMIRPGDDIEEAIFVDDDRVGAENVGTSFYFNSHVGQPKVAVLASLFYQKWRIKCHPLNGTFTNRVLGKKVDWDDLVIDTFDNPRSRINTIKYTHHVLHASVGEHGQGAVLWDEDYSIPEITYERGEAAVCTNELGAPIIRLTAAYAASSIDEFLRRKRKFSFPVVWRPVDYNKEVMDEEERNKL